MINKPNSRLARIRKHIRVRKKVKGTTQRPRLCVYRSLQHIHVQIIDDTNGTTLVAASTLEADVRKKFKVCGNKEAAKEVGKIIAKKALDSGITEVVFDRGGFPYHGRVEALAEAAREAGLKF